MNFVDSAGGPDAQFPSLIAGHKAAEPCQTALMKRVSNAPQKRQLNMPLRFDLTGQRFERLTALSHVGHGYWFCQCDCGRQVKRLTSRLRTGGAKSCGCLEKDKVAERARCVDGAGLVRHAALLQCLAYDPETGIFTWKVSPAPNVKVGSIAGRPRGGDGYWGIHIFGRTYAAHHVAWFYVHGVWPTARLDHRNLRRNDNGIANLREATDSQNQQNTSLPRNNTSGFKGVSKHGNRWSAEIMVDLVAHRLGLFDTAEQASAAYLDAKRALHSHYIEGQGVRA